MLLHHCDHCHQGTQNMTNHRFFFLFFFFPPQGLLCAGRGCVHRWIAQLWCYSYIFNLTANRARTSSVLFELFFSLKFHLRSLEPVESASACDTDGLLIQYPYGETSCGSFSWCHHNGTKLSAASLKWLAWKLTTRLWYTWYLCMQPEVIAVTQPHTKWVFFSLFWADAWFEIAVLWKEWSAYRLIEIL